MLNSLLAIELYLPTCVDENPPFLFLWEANHLKTGYPEPVPDLSVFNKRAYAADSMLTALLWV